MNSRYFLYELHCDSETIDNVFNCSRFILVDYSLMTKLIHIMILFIFPSISSTIPICSRRIRERKDDAFMLKNEESARQSYHFVISFPCSTWSLHSALSFHNQNEVSNNASNLSYDMRSLCLFLLLLFLKVNNIQSNNQKDRIYN
jgi:hypothetical protein